jgi:hypothetical protein
MAATLMLGEGQIATVVEEEFEGVRQRTLEELPLTVDN